LKSNELAHNAVLSLAESDRKDVREFNDFLDKEVISPIARVASHPIYRFDDIQKNNHCYLSDEKNRLVNLDFVTSQYGVFGSYLQFSNGVQSNSQNYVGLAIQLISGMELKRAAAEDNVSLETKRSQVKSIMSKLGVNRQQDVIRKILPLLTRLTDPTAWDKETPSLFVDYANKFLPDQARSYSLTDRKNRAVRIIEYGPVSGRPILVLHPLIFPDITDSDIEYAQAHNLRLIWPLRPGLLRSAQVKQNIQSYLEDSLEGIDLAWVHLCGEPVHIIAMVSSARYAVIYAQQNPTRVSGLTFAATCFSAGKYENSFTYFGNSVAELCSRNTWLMSKTIDFIRNKFIGTSRFKATIMRVHQNSKPDLAVLDREFSEPHHGNRIKMALIESPESVKHDYFNQVHFRWSQLKKLGTPVKFVHGE